MTWQEVIVSADELGILLVGISVGGGTLTNSRGSGSRTCRAGTSGSAAAPP